MSDRKVISARISSELAKSIEENTIGTAKIIEALCQYFLTLSAEEQFDFVVDNTPDLTDEVRMYIKENLRQSEIQHLPMEQKGAWLSTSLTGLGKITSLVGAGITLALAQEVVGGALRKLKSKKENEEV